ncbi:cupin domain-containing protein [Gordonia sp. CPCC 205515]|uniref:cupin domain-containing protein n=1 Tax=Gordonia sp. CPCC 205515 TaxID=3140791 RepID=UPI003AF3B52C
MSEKTTARVVVSGTDAAGRSAVVADGPTQTWAWRPDGSRVMDLWRTDMLPSSVDADNALTGEVVDVPRGGLVVRMCTFAPNSDMDAVAYAAAIADVYGRQPENTGVPGMHRTDSVDVVTVVSGEVYAVLETAETLLRAGDCFVQRGTAHAWHNRSGQPATVVSTMVSADR